MPFVVQASLDGHTLSATTATAKEAFAKAVEWQVTEPLGDVSITDSNKTYSVEAFSVAMALLEITQTVNDAVDAKAERKCK